MQAHSFLGDDRIVVRGELELVQTGPLPRRQRTPRLWFPKTARALAAHGFRMTQRLFRRTALASRPSLRERTPMRRVSVVGTTGSGKTIFARDLACALDAERIELDMLYWGPNWTERPIEIFMRETDAATARERWVADRNYS